VAEGERRDLQALLDWAVRGPQGARVDRQEIRWSQAAGSFTDFLITG
jgi:acylphosphatase